MPDERALIIQLQRPTGDWVDVGELVNSGSRNTFRSYPGYWDLPRRPVLGQIFEDHENDWSPSTSTALPHWFSHLLPEGRLRQAVSDASQFHRTREFDLIAVLGRDDLPGAIRAVASTPTSGSVHTSTDEVDSEPPDDEPAVLKFSLAGAQLKFSVYSADSGLTVPARGTAGNFIAKFPDGRIGHTDVPVVELGSMELARAAGFDVPHAELIDPASVVGLEGWARQAREPALLVARFDRRAAGVRTHMEELAQILDVPPHREQAKYRYGNFELVAALFAALTGPKSVPEVVARIVLNVLIGNGDAHLKNWAVVYPDGMRPAMSPVYDLVPTALYIQPDDLGMNLAGSKDFASVTPASFDGVAARTGVETTVTRRAAAEAVERVLTAWPVLRDHFPSALYERLTDRLDTLELARR